jgi:hypothetical protein
MTDEERLKRIEEIVNNYDHKFKNMEGKLYLFKEMMQKNNDLLEQYNKDVKDGLEKFFRNYKDENTKYIEDIILSPKRLERLEEKVVYLLEVMEELLNNNGIINKIKRFWTFLGR